MPRFVVTLTDEQKAGLELLRQQRSLRSEAHVIRQLIDHALSSGLPTPERQEAIKARAVQRQTEYREFGMEGTEWSAEEAAQMKRRPRAEPIVLNRIGVGPAPVVPGSRLKKR